MLLTLKTWNKGFVVVMAFPFFLLLKFLPVVQHREPLTILNEMIANLGQNIQSSVWDIAFDGLQD